MKKINIFYVVALSIILTVSIAILSCVGVVIYQNNNKSYKSNLITVSFDYNTPSYISAYGGNFENFSNKKNKIEIQRGNWLGEFPTFESNLISECLVGWMLEGTDVLFDRYTQLYGNVTLQAVWDEIKLEENFGYTEGLKIQGSSVVKYEGNAASVSFPKNVLVGDKLSKITSIGALAFYQNLSIQSIEIPESVTSIGERAFAYCDYLVSANIPDGVTILERCVFENCYSLKTLTISSNSKLTTIKHRALSDAGVDTLRLPSQLANIEDQVFGRGVYKNIFIDSNFVASSYDIMSDMLRYVNADSKVYIKADIETVSSCLTTNFTQQTSDKTGYNMWVINS